MSSELSAKITHWHLSPGTDGSVAHAYRGNLKNTLNFSKGKITSFHCWCQTCSSSVVSAGGSQMKQLPPCLLRAWMQLSTIHQDLMTRGNPRRIQISQGLLCSPSLSPPTAWNSLGTEEASPDVPALLPPVTLPKLAGKYGLKTQIYFNAQLQQNYLCCHKPGAGFKEDFSSLPTETTSFEIKPLKTP